MYPEEVKQDAINRAIKKAQQEKSDYDMERTKRAVSSSNTKDHAVIVPIAPRTVR